MLLVILIMHTCPLCSLCYCFLLRQVLTKVQTICSKQNQDKRSNVCRLEIYQEKFFSSDYLERSQQNVHTSQCQGNFAREYLDALVPF